ncbi:MAG TPA: ATP-binding protein [Polyangiaceae bacterium]
MKSRAYVDEALSLGELPAFTFESGEYLKARASGTSGARPMPTGGSTAELEHQFGRMQDRIDELESLLEERTSELFLARETERQISGALVGVRDAPPGALLMLERSGTIASINQAALTLLGYDERELLGQPLRMLLEDPDSDCLVEAEALAPEGTALRTEQTWIAKSGLRVRVLFSIAALGVVDPHGQPRRFVCTAFELGARRNWEIGVRHAEKLETVGRLSAGVAQEIGTPIQFVSDGVQFMRDASEDLFLLVEKHRAVLSAIRAGEDAREAASCVEAVEADADLAYSIANMSKAIGGCIEGIERMRSTVRSMQEFAQPDPREMAEVDLNHAILSTLTVARNEYKHVAHLSTEFGLLPPVYCHVGELNQAVLNLVVNAARAVAEVTKGTDKKGRITVRTRLDGDAVIVSIEDTGAGIPEPIRNRIFDPFFTTKERRSGTGQGLTIARTIVADKHGGKLWFETVVGQGTTFFLRVPCRGQNTTPSENTTPPR